MGPKVGPTQKWQIWSLSAVDVDVRKWSSSHDSDLSRAPAPIAWPNFQQKSAFRELQPSVVFFYFAAYFAELDSFFFSLSPFSSLPLQGSCSSVFHCLQIFVFCSNLDWQKLRCVSCCCCCCWRWSGPGSLPEWKPVQERKKFDRKNDSDVNECSCCWCNTEALSAAGLFGTP